jgi:hypothetical protein
MEMSSTTQTTPKISLQHVGATPTAIAEISRNMPGYGKPGFDALLQHLLSGLLTRHVYGDWGDVCQEDAKANDYALKSGSRLLSVYHVFGVKLYVISDAAGTADPSVREVTTILLPSDY